MPKFLKYIFRFFILFFITVFFITAFVFGTLKLIASDISPTAKTIFTTTLLESGQMKFVASWFLSKEEIQKVVESNSAKDIEANVDETLIDFIATKSEIKNDKGYRIEKVYGLSYMGKVLIVDDPSRIKVATISEFGERGKELGKIVEENKANAGVNAGLYKSDLNSGGEPRGVVIVDGNIVYNKPQWITGLYLIGFDTNNILKILDINGFTSAQVEELVSKEKIRDAVCFQEESSDKNNHFVKIMINGKERETDGMGSGANPRTVVGQRKDGSVIFLVTDGRGRDGHLGANMKDLIKVMKKYDVVNAANLDGGSSSSMYVDGKYEMTSVTLYNTNSSWRLPDAFIIK